MNFDLTEDQQLLVKTVQKFCKTESPVERVRKMRDVERGWTPETWAKIGELGWLMVAFPEDAGGLGGSMVDAGLILEQLGKSLVPEPYIASVALGGMAIAKAGSPEQIEQFLAPMLAGETSLALAYSESGARFNPHCIATKAEKTADGYSITGDKTFVLNGHAADRLVVAARTSGEVGDEKGIGLFIVDPAASGVTVQRVTCMDSQNVANIRFEGAKVSGGQVLGEPDGAGPLLDYLVDCGAAATCAEGAGAMQAALAMTREYLVEREQFGTKIGTFQALQHRCVDMFVETELAKGTALMAMIKLDDPDPNERRRAVSAAKWQLAKGGGYVGRQATQLHGGIGVTDEHDIGLYFKRLHILGTLFGDEEYHVRRYMNLPGFVSNVA